MAEGCKVYEDSGERRNVVIMLPSLRGCLALSRHRGQEMPRYLLGYRAIVLLIAATNMITPHTALGGVIG